MNRNHCSRPLTGYLLSNRCKTRRWWNFWVVLVPLRGIYYPISSNQNLIPIVSHGSRPLTGYLLSNRASQYTAASGSELFSSPYGVSIIQSRWHLNISRKRRKRFSSPYGVSIIQSQSKKLIGQSSIRSRPLTGYLLSNQGWKCGSIPSVCVLVPLRGIYYPIRILLFL